METTIKKYDWPTKRGSYEGIAVQFGTYRAELINWALNTGDPLADNVVKEMHEVGMKRAREQFQLAAKQGISAVKNPLPNLKAFFEEVEKIPDYVDDDLLENGNLPFFTIPRHIHSIALTTGSLVRVYGSPSIAKVLALTGRLIEGADRRLEETRKWLLQVSPPGSLKKGEDGYVATLYVRLLHAHMRRFAVKKGYDEKAYGVAINQIDNVRTWLDFNYTPYTLISKLGYDLTPSELESIFLYWRYVGRLLGVDDRFLAGIKDFDSARRINEMVEAVTGAPIEESKTLTKATLSALVKTLEKMANMPPEKAKPLVYAITRKAQGNAMSDQLGIPRIPAADKELDQMTIANRNSREEHRMDPVKWEQIIQENLLLNKQALDEIKDPTAYERGAHQSND